MADKNILSLSFNDQETANFGSSALIVNKVAPKNANISAAGVPSGDIIFEVNTPKDTFLDLSKTYMSMRYAIAGAVNTLYIHKQMLLPCMFARAVVYLNGVKISQSNNYTQDGVLSRRLQFGKDYNKSVSGIYDLPDIANDDAGTTPAGNYIGTDTLDSFWLKQSEGLIIPPNCNLRFEFTIDNNYINKCALKTTAIAAVFTGMTINSFWMHPCYYVNPSEVKDSYRLRFVGMNSFMSSSTQVNGATIPINLQYTISPTIVKACVTHLPSTYQTIADANRKFESAFLFNSGIVTLKSLQLKVGNVVFPQSAYTFDYGFEEAYEDYINQSQQIAKDSGKEEYAMYRNSMTVPDRNNWGPILVSPIVKDETDPTNTIEMNATYTNTSGADITLFVILTCLEEQKVDIVHSGNEIVTTPTK